MAHRKLHVDRVFHALGDPTRRVLMERLSQGPITVSRLAKPLAITLAAVVQHLQVLEKSGLVRTEKLGRVRTCRIESDGAFRRGTVDRGSTSDLGEQVGSVGGFAGRGRLTVFLERWLLSYRIYCAFYPLQPVR